MSQMVKHSFGSKSLRIPEYNFSDRQSSTNLIWICRGHCNLLMLFMCVCVMVCRKSYSRFEGACWNVCTYIRSCFMFLCSVTSKYVKLRSSSKCITIIQQKSLPLLWRGGAVLVVVCIHQETKSTQHNIFGTSSFDRTYRFIVIVKIFFTEPN